MQDLTVAAGSLRMRFFVLSISIAMLGSQRVRVAYFGRMRSPESSNVDALLADSIETMLGKHPALWPLARKRAVAHRHSFSECEPGLSKNSSLVYVKPDSDYQRATSTERNRQNRFNCG